MSTDEFIDSSLFFGWSAEPASSVPFTSDTASTTEEDVHWYCVHTKPSKEARVAEYLAHTLHLETYYPKFRQFKTIRRKRELVTRPLFPRYLFCRFDPQTTYRSVRYAPDAIDIVHLADRPAVVRDEIIESLRAWAGEELDVITAPSELLPGDPVEIFSGPLRGLAAVIVRATDDRDRVAILLSVLQNAQLTISRSQLRRLE